MESRSFEVVERMKFTSVYITMTCVYHLVLFFKKENYYKVHNHVSFFSQARRITAMSSPLMGKRKTTYLAIINFSNNPEIYYWVNKSSTKFDKLQDIPASMAADISFFEMGNSLYMLMSSRKNIEIFRGEVV